MACRTFFISETRLGGMATSVFALAGIGVFLLIAAYVFYELLTPTESGLVAPDDFGTSGGKTDGGPGDKSVATPDGGDVPAEETDRERDEPSDR